MTAPLKYLSKSSNKEAADLLIQIRAKKPITKKQLDSIGGSLKQLNLDEAKLKKVAWTRK